MVRLHKLLMVVAVAVLATGCDRVTSTEAELDAGTAASAVAAAPGCAKRPDFVADDVASLSAANTGAPPGSVIAIRGMIEIPADIEVTTDGLTFTCATPGSGISAEPSGGVGSLFNVRSKNVTVEKLVLDARETTVGPFWAENDGGASLAERPAFHGNTVKCGPECIRFIGTPDAVAADNSIDAEGTQNAINFNGVKGGRIERNRMTSDTPTSDGIVLQGSHGIQIIDNDIVGPWLNRAILIADGSSRVWVERNRATGGFSDEPGFFSSAVELFEVSGVTIVRNRLFCDPARCSSGLVFGGVERTRVAHNEVACGHTTCLLGVGADVLDVAVIDNRFTSAGSATGVHFENQIIDVRITNNTIVTTAPSPNTAGSLAGGVHIRDGEGALVTANTILGPWVHSVSVTAFVGAKIEGNRLGGAQLHAVRLSGDDNRVDGNRVDGAGDVPFFLTEACRNDLAGNRIENAVGGVGYLLDVTTGDNRIVENRTVVVDHGDFDCDGDGIPDPNLVTGGA